MCELCGCMRMCEVCEDARICVAVRMYTWPSSGYCHEPKVKLNVVALLEVWTQCHRDTVSRDTVSHNHLYVIPIRWCVCVEKGVGGGRGWWVCT